MPNSRPWRWKDVVNSQRLPNVQVTTCQLLQIICSFCSGKWFFSWNAFKSTDTEIDSCCGALWLLTSKQLANHLNLNWPSFSIALRTSTSSGMLFHRGPAPSSKLSRARRLRLIKNNNEAYYHCQCISENQIHLKSNWLRNRKSCSEIKCMIRNLPARVHCLS